VKFIKSTEII